MTNICVWQSFINSSVSNNTKHFEQFISFIQSLDNNSSPELWTKWKNYSNQVVIETQNYFFKIYQEDTRVGKFILRVREELAKIYRNDFGVNWEIYTVEANNSIFQIERREKLEVCTPDKVSFEEIILAWYKILLKLEENLFLDKLVPQLIHRIPELYKIKLVRDCINKHEDYAFTKNGNIILLDDADWFLGLIDKKNNWLSIMYDVFNIVLPYCEAKLVPLNIGEITPTEIRNQIKRWTIIEDDILGIEKVYRDFYSVREKALSDNIKVLATGELIAADTPLYVEGINSYAPIASLSQIIHSSESR